MFALLATASCLFIPPEGWEIADPKTPSKHAIVGFVDNHKAGFFPSLHLTHEKTDLPIEQYLKIVQKNYQIKKQTFRHLGKIETKSGPADLIEVEVSSAFGPVRLLQALLPYNEDLFILTAGALKKQFNKAAPCIEKAFQSMRICDDLFSLVGEEADSLRDAWQKRKSGIESRAFEQKVVSHKELGPVWQMYMSKL